MALYRGSTKLSGIGNGFTPANEGITDQVLTKTSGGYEWATLATGGLPVEFVEKLTIDKVGNNQSIGTYSYPVFVIANLEDSQGYARVGTLKGNVGGGTYYPSDSYYTRYMDSGFFPANSTITFYSGASGTLTVWIYKLNLPS